MRVTKSILAVLLFAAAAGAQEPNLPVVKSNVSVITIQDGAELKKNFWTLAPEAKPVLLNPKIGKVTTRPALMF